MTAGERLKRLHLPGGLSPNHSIINTVIASNAQHYNCQQHNSSLLRNTHPLKLEHLFPKLQTFDEYQHVLSMIPLQIWPSVLSLSSANECAWMGESACFSVLTKKDCVILPYTSRSCSPFSSVILHEVRLRMKSSTRYLSLYRYVQIYICHCIALDCITLIPFHSIPLDAIRLHCNVYTMSCCHTYITLSYVHYITLQYNTLHYNTLQCIALHIALHVALHLHDTTLHYHTSIHPSIHPCMHPYIRCLSSRGSTL